MAVVGNSYLYHMRKVGLDLILKYKNILNSFFSLQDLVENIEPGVAQVSALFFSFYLSS